MRDYFANYDIVTPAIVEAVANHEAEVLTTHKSKSILRQSEEPGTNDTADKLIAWAGDVAIEQLASLSKVGTRSCRETYKRLNVCCKNSNEVKALESYPKKTQSLEYDVFYEGIICRLLSAFSHQSDLRIRGNIIHEAIQEAEETSKQNENARKEFEKFKTSPVYLKSIDFSTSTQVLPMGPPPVVPGSSKKGRGKAMQAQKQEQIQTNFPAFHMLCVTGSSILKH